MGKVFLNLLGNDVQTKKVNISVGLGRNTDQLVQNGANIAGQSCVKLGLEGVIGRVRKGRGFSLGDLEVYGKGLVGFKHVVASRNLGTRLQQDYFGGVEAT